MPNDSTDNDRVQQVAEILARGVLRLRKQRICRINDVVAEAAKDQNSSTTGLDLCVKTRLTVPSG